MKSLGQSGTDVSRLPADLLQREDFAGIDSIDDSAYVLHCRGSRRGIGREQNDHVVSSGNFCSRPIRVVRPVKNRPIRLQRQRGAVLQVCERQRIALAGVEKADGFAILVGELPEDPVFTAVKLYLQSKTAGDSGVEAQRASSAICLR